LVQLSVKSDIKRTVKKLNRIQRRQVPFAVAKALTVTTRRVQRAEVRQLDKDFDRPTPFTKRAFKVIRAEKRDFLRGVAKAILRIKPIQDAYLKTQIKGGTKLPRGRAHVIGRDARTNRYGNLPRGTVKRLLARQDTFSGTVGRTRGIWQRTGRGKRDLKLLVQYVDRTSYSPRFRFFETANRTARRFFGRQLEVEITKAIRTAR